MSNIDPPLFLRILSQNDFSILAKITIFFNRIFDVMSTFNRINLEQHRYIYKIKGCFLDCQTF